jgi:hypothetical protein
MRSCSMHGRDKIYVQNCIHVVAKIVSIVYFPTFLLPSLISLPLSSFLCHLFSHSIYTSASHMMPEILFITTCS